MFLGTLKIYKYCRTILGSTDAIDVFSEMTGKYRICLGTCDLKKKQIYGGARGTLKTIWTHLDSCWDDLTLQNYRNSTFQLKLELLGTVLGPQNLLFCLRSPQNTFVVVGFNISQSSYFLFIFPKTVYDNGTTSCSTILDSVSRS